MIIAMQAEATPAQTSEEEGPLQKWSLEVHPNPEKALEDGAQSITIPAFQTLMGELNVIGKAIGRRL